MMQREVATIVNQAQCINIWQVFPAPVKRGQFVIVRVLLRDIVTSIVALESIVNVWMQILPTNTGRYIGSLGIA